MINRKKTHHPPNWCLQFWAARVPWGAAPSARAWQYSGPSKAALRWMMHAAESPSNLQTHWQKRAAKLVQRQEASRDGSAHNPCASCSRSINSTFLKMGFLSFLFFWKNDKFSRKNILIFCFFTTKRKNIFTQNTFFFFLRIGGPCGSNRNKCDSTAQSFSVYHFA